MPYTDHVYQVSEFLTEAKSLLEMSYRSVWLEGEISSLRALSSGHLYFTLKDDNSQIRCAMFRNRATRSKVKPDEGQLVQVRAKFTIYEARGDVQLIVEELKDVGAGQLLKQFEELKLKLANEGLFAEQNKQKIPLFPKHVGVITSSSGAALRDIISTLKRRNSSLPVTIYPSLVQGSEAPKTLVKALQDCAKHSRCDVVIIARGGGSIEDLASFNDEKLARMIASYPLPLISAVGHEVDFTITDFVADLRAATPTAAAELVAPERSRLLAEITARGLRMQTVIGQKLQTRAQAVDLLSRSIASPKNSLSMRVNATQLLSGRMYQTISGHLGRARSLTYAAQQGLRRLNPEKQIAVRRGLFEQKINGLHLQMSTVLKDQQNKTALAAERLRLINPLGVLERGYALAQVNQPGRDIVKSVDQVKAGDGIKVIVADGQISAQVLKTKPDDRQ